MGSRRAVGVLASGVGKDVGITWGKRRPELWAQAKDCGVGVGAGAGALSKPFLPDTSIGYF